MLTRGAVGGVVAAALAGAALLPVTPAAADGSACVTKREFGAVKAGWTPARVAATFDTEGKRVTVADYSEVRRYPKCAGGTPVIVNYERKALGTPLRLTSKYW